MALISMESADYLMWGNDGLREIRLQVRGLGSLWCQDWFTTVDRGHRGQVRA